MSRTHTGKTPMDVVHKDAIQIETIQKEQRTQKLYTVFSINPYKKIHVLTDNPMVNNTEVVEEDRSFLQAIHQARLGPTEKYNYPQTESQEIGWISKPLIMSDRSDRRLNFYRQNSEITKYMDAAWRVQ